MGTLDRITPDKGTAKVAVTMGLALFFGGLAVFIALYGEGTIWRGMLWAAAWSSVGWFLGFLFGIPRNLSSDTARTPGATALERAKQEVVAAVDAAKLARAKADEAAKARQAVDPADSAAVARAKADSDVADKAAAEADKVVEAAKAKETAANSSATAAPRASLSVNTNLEQISDWLTKIIVGVSLVESQTLLAHMHHAAAFMAKSMASTQGVAAWMSAQQAAALAQAAASAAEAASAAAPAASAAAAAASSAAAAQASNLAVFASMESVAYAIMLYFLATGLLGSYLLTRLFLQRVLQDAATESAS